MTFGILVFVSGEGIWGPFALVKHNAPVVPSDLFYPVFQRIIVLMVLELRVLGVLLACGRLRGVLGVAFALGVPCSIYALLGGVSVTHLLAGALPGCVCSAVLGALDQVQFHRRQEPSQIDADSSR